MYVARKTDRERDRHTVFEAFLATSHVLVAMNAEACIHACFEIMVAGTCLLSALRSREASDL
eukprot:243919-Pleurochrysis_carterae.AAC.2